MDTERHVTVDLSNDPPNENNVEQADDMRVGPRSRLATINDDDIISPTTSPVATSTSIGCRMEVSVKVFLLE